MKKLDQSRPFGRLYGTYDGRLYEQDGVAFDCDFNEWKAPAVAATSPMQLSAQIETGPRPRTKEEEKQYQADVLEAAKLLAAKMVTEGASEKQKPAEQKP